MSAVMKAVVHFHRRSGKDVFIHTTVFVPGKGWLVHYELGDTHRVAFVRCGSKPKVVWHE